MCRITEFKKVIEPNKLIETKCNNNRDWITTVILNSYENFIEIEQGEDYLTSVLMIGDKLTCRYITPSTIYIAETEVYNIKVASRTIVLNLIGVEKIENTRRHKRYDVYLSASLSKDNTIGECYCVVVNVSISGVTIITKSNLDIEELINLTMYFKHFNFFTSKCSVVWHDKSEDNNKYGLKIVEIDEITKFQYGSYIRRLQRKESRLRKRGEKLMGL